MYLSISIEEKKKTTVKLHTNISIQFGFAWVRYSEKKTGGKWKKKKERKKKLPKTEFKKMNEEEEAGA